MRPESGPFGKKSSANVTNAQSTVTWNAFLNIRRFSSVSSVVLEVGSPYNIN
jgi:hypothetical protein